MKFTLIQKSLPDFMGIAHLYKIGDYHVVVSAVHNDYTFETMAFFATPDGKITSYTEIARLRSTLDHNACMVEVSRKNLDNLARKG